MLSGEPEFNLVDCDWIPVDDGGQISLKEAFSPGANAVVGLAGTVVEKISILKLLLAIAQSAHTPEDENEWLKLTNNELSRHCLDYLQLHHDQFFLFGSRPFLQFPVLKELGAEKKPYSTIQTQVASGNTTILTQIEIGHAPDKAEIARLLIQQSAFAIGGKQSVFNNRNIKLTTSRIKPISSYAGPSLGKFGFLHSFIKGKTLLDTIRMNLFDKKSISAMGIFNEGVGVPPWEKMPEGEEDQVAVELMDSLVGRLVPLCRFCLMDEDGVFFTEGIRHLDYASRMVDPSITTLASKDGGLSPLWVSVEKRPWRELPAILSFLGKESKSRCFQINLLTKRLTGSCDSIGIWSGGLRVRSNSGETFIRQDDDEVESLIEIPLPNQENHKQLDIWYSIFRSEMQFLEKLSVALISAVKGYHSTLHNDDGGQRYKSAEMAFWSVCENHAQQLCDACDETSTEARETLRKVFRKIASDCYDNFCPCGTSRQYKSWAKNKRRLYVKSSASTGGSEVRA